MKKYAIVFAMVLVLLIAGCSSSNNISNQDLEEYNVKQTIDETTQDDFTFRLVSEKEAYENGNDVTLYGEITYTGDKDEVTIHHSSSAILFSMKEKVRGYDIGFDVEDIGASTTLKQGEPYREKYEKSGGYAEEDASNYVRFMKDFLDREDFPSGYYVVNGETDFSLEDQNTISMEATIDFKVLK